MLNVVSVFWSLQWWAFWIYRVTHWCIFCGSKSSIGLKTDLNEKLLSWFKSKNTQTWNPSSTKPTTTTTQREKTTAHCPASFPFNSPNFEGLGRIIENNVVFDFEIICVCNLLFERCFRFNWEREISFQFWLKVERFFLSFSAPREVLKLKCTKLMLSQSRLVLSLYI